MPKKLLNPLEDPPTASSSEDEEVEHSSSEDEEQISNPSSEEDEPKDPATETLKTPSPAKPAVSLSSGSETGSDSESEPAEKTVAVTAAKSKKKKSEVSTPVKSGKKRGSEATTSTNTKEHAKRAKKVSGDDEKRNVVQVDKKPRFQRLWSEEDEISLLQGMIDFKAEKGTSPYDDMNGFFDEYKKCISFNVSKTQFSDKIRSLRNKYRGKDNKGNKTFSKSHDEKCLRLANCIWGSDGLALNSAVKSPVKSKKVDPKKKKKKLESEVEDEDKEVLGSDAMALESVVVKANGNGKKVESLKPEGEKVDQDNEVMILDGDSESSNLFENSFLIRSIVSLGLDEYSVKQKWSKMPIETKKRIEEKLKMVKAMEYKLVVQKADVVKQVASVINEAV
ncbi:hypothetical protein CARUB_v10013903mg [Capsella rubella]|uniref:Uncharacterized protein n=1 Tax=Capsella rubella TaxID=81985 RepID=R0G5T3_9BRAS|nr:probable transcription factor At1g44810 [Capsella rubella]EOA30761.1 hypothetical protein CARUB_v10013903mg [Capsella rubella]